MKKFVLIALVLVIATTFAFAAFQASAGGVAAAPPQTMSFRIFPPWLPSPDVGWNS